AALVAPSGNRIAGSAGVINLLGKYPDQMLLRAGVGVVITIPSVHQSSRRGDSEGPPAPNTPPETPEQRRQRAVQDLEKLKQVLREAKAYAEMKSRSGAGGGARDAALEAMVPVMRGQTAAICTADHFRDIQAAVALGNEFGLRVIVAGGAEAAKVVDLLK